MKLSNVISGAVAVAILTSAGAYLNSTERAYSESIKKGEVELFCNLNGDYRKVPASKFKEFREINGKSIYYFTNGSASNCYIKKGGE